MLGCWVQKPDLRCQWSRSVGCPRTIQSVGATIRGESVEFDSLTFSRVPMQAILTLYEVRTSHSSPMFVPTLKSTLLQFLGGLRCARSILS